MTEPRTREDPLRRLPSHTISDILIPMSEALDLAEGRDSGHAQRVAYVALAIAEHLGLDDETRLACAYAGLFHDVGVISAGSGLSGQMRADERLVFASLPLMTPEEAAIEVRSSSPDIVVDRILDPAVYGARAAHDLELPTDAVGGIGAHHEQWDGGGYPHGLEGPDIPLVGRIVCVADHVESLLSHEISPLAARRNLPHWLARFAGSVADPELVSATRSLTAGDGFWLGLYSANLPLDLRGQCSRLHESKANRLLPFAERFAELMDARFTFTVGVSPRVAKLAEALGKSAGIPDVRLKQLRLAALLHDVGQLGISERIMAKPGILSVEELEVLRQHPVHSHQVLSGISGLEEVAEWVLAHHERPDGRGYPEGRTEDEIPFEARILAIADAYVAITSDRPHRRRAGREDGLRRLASAAGSQLDDRLVEMFVGRVIA